MNAYHSYQFAWRIVDTAAELRRLSKLASSVRDKRPVARYLAMSVGVERAPLLLAVMEGQKLPGGKGGITSQIAVQMSVTAALERAQAAREEYNPKNTTNLPLASFLAKEALQSANTQVYEYTHRMSVGGKLAATGLVVCYDGEQCTVARVGGYGTFLWREGRLVELCEGQEEPQGAGVLQRFIGANSQILADLATAKLKEGDVLIFSTFPWEKEVIEEAGKLLASAGALDGVADDILRFQAERTGKVTALDKNFFVSLVRVGSPVIKLNHALHS